MSAFTKEHIELLRQYFLSDSPGIKDEILLSFPTELREKVLLLQNEFEKGNDPKSIAFGIQAEEFEKELEEIQASFYLNQLGLSSQEFERELLSAIKPIERENLKKKLIAFEESDREDFSEIELQSAISLVERESLKKKLQGLESEGVLKPAAVTVPGSSPFFQFLKYAVAACVVLALGIGVYQFTRKDVVLENIVASSGEDKTADQIPEVVQEIETLPLSEISTKTNALLVIKSGLGFGDTEEKITVVENDQRERILSLQKAISRYQSQLGKAGKSENQAAVQLNNELQKRIASLKEDLNVLNERENKYLFNGKNLTLYSSSVGKERRIISFDGNYYLKIESNFFKLSISKEPQLFQKETDSNVLKALDKILFNAE